MASETLCCIPFRSIAKSVSHTKPLPERKSQVWCSSQAKWVDAEVKPVSDGRVVASYSDGDFLRQKELKIGSQNYRETTASSVEEKEASIPWACFNELLRGLKTDKESYGSDMVPADTGDSISCSMARSWTAAHWICQRIFDKQSEMEDVRTFMSNLAAWQKPFLDWQPDDFFLFKQCFELWTDMKRLGGTAAPRDIEAEEFNGKKQNIDRGFARLAERDRLWKYCDAQNKAQEVFCNLCRKKGLTDEAWCGYCDLWQAMSQREGAALNQLASTQGNLAALVYNDTFQNDFGSLDQCNRRSGLVRHMQRVLRHIPARMRVAVEVNIRSPGGSGGDLPDLVGSWLSLGHAIIDLALKGLADSGFTSHHLHILMRFTAIKLMLIDPKKELDADNIKLPNCEHTLLDHCRELSSLLGLADGNSHNHQRDLDVVCKLARSELNTDQNKAVLMSFLDLLRFSN